MSDAESTFICQNTWCK